MSHYSSRNYEMFPDGYLLEWVVEKFSKKILSFLFSTSACLKQLSNISNFFILKDFQILNLELIVQYTEHK